MADLVELIRACPHCGGEVLYEQKLQYVRQGKAAPALVGPKQGQLILRETAAWSVSARPTGRTKVWCLASCQGDNGYLGSVPASHWEGPRWWDER
jgi:hypothetical protein